MRRQIILLATFAALTICGPSMAETAGVPGAAAPLMEIPWPEWWSDLPPPGPTANPAPAVPDAGKRKSANVTGVGPLPKAETQSVDGALPLPLLMTEIATWLSTNFELPMSTEHPRVEFASAMQLAARRYGSLTPLPELSPSTLLDLGRNLVAVYHDAKRTIFLLEGWTGESPVEQSILVHEMVHHLQNVGAVKYECAAAREKPAYLAQDRWLQRFEQDLATEFDVDMFAIIVRSACGPG